jgi:hypothetical protein
MDRAFAKEKRRQKSSRVVNSKKKRTIALGKGGEKGHYICVPREPKLLTHPMASRKTKRKKEPFLVRSFTLTASLDKVLKRISQEATDHTGWTVSTSAVVRALGRYVDHQGDGWVRSELLPFVEQELHAGVIGGSRKK